MNINKMKMSKKRGFAMALALVAFVILVITGAALLSIGMQNRLLSVRTSADIVARCAADSALVEAFFKMNKKLQLRPWDDNALPKATNFKLPLCDALYSYTIVSDSNGTYHIYSVGQSGIALKKTDTTIRLKGLFDYAVFVDGAIMLRNGVKIDGYNSSDGPYGGSNRGLSVTVGTNSTATGAIDLKNGAGVIGDVVVGPGSNPREVINGNLNEITGDTYAANEPRELTAVKPPSLAYQGEKPAGIITRSGRYDTIYLGNGEKLVIKGNVDLHITKDAVLDNGGVIEITEGSSLNLYLDRNLITKNSSEINNLTHLPSSLRILGTSATAVDYHFYAKTNFYGVVYAPKSCVHLNNGAAIYGAVVADALTQDVSANIHYDQALQDVSVNDVGVRFVMDRWNE
jgi:hypothetical protein